MGRKKNSEVAEAKPNPKREAVQKAMEELGSKADAGKMAEYIKEKFNLDIENKVIGIHRHHIQLAAKKKNKAANAAAAAPRKAARSGDVSFDEISVVKELVKRHGAQRIRDVIELLS